MFRQGEHNKRRLNLHSVARVRSLEVARGRSGYGFTLHGQAPCCLGSILKGSPADYVGLKSGDQILTVNNVNVSKASHEDVVKLIGRCSGVLHLVIAEGTAHRDSCSSDEEFGFHDTKGYWLKPRVDSKTLGINRAERVVAEMQSGGIFNMIFDNSSHSSGSLERVAPAKVRPLSEPDFTCRSRNCTSKSNPDLLSEEEMAKVLNDDSVFVGAFENQEDFALDASILNVRMIVGYLGSIELASTGVSLESDSLQAIRGCMRRLRAEQKIHSLVMMKIMHDCVQLWNDKGVAIATYPAEKLAFSAMCPDDRRFFGLVTMQVSDDLRLAHEDDGGLRTSCHVFIVDPDLCPHVVHQGVARRFGFDCTPDPDTNGCLEFPPMSQPLLQFVSVLYRDMGESIEGMRARGLADGDLDAQQNNSTSSNSDSGIGNFLPEEKSNSRVLLVDLGSNPSRHAPNSPWESTPARNAGQASALRNGYRYELEGKFHLSEMHHPDPPLLTSSRPHLGPSARMEVPVPSRHPHYPNGKIAGVAATTHSGRGGQRWLPVHVLQDWRHGNGSDQESYAESTDGWSSANCSTLPPPMSKIPADRYRVAGEIARPARVGPQKDEWAKKLFSADKAYEDQPNVKRSKEKEKKGSTFGGLALGFPHLTQRSSGRRSFGRSKRLSLARSLDDLESAAVSDGELNSVDLRACGSENSLSSNASLPSVQSHRRHPDRRVASWAVCFERLLQDPVGVRYFSVKGRVENQQFLNLEDCDLMIPDVNLTTEFLKKEFSEENILFWQACEYFSHVPENDKKQLSQRAREIYNSFLSSKATTPVNIDSQAQLADDILNAPRPEMFKEQQLQIFNLMKFDSYSRFLKSSLYQECMLAEVEGRPLPDPCHIPGSPASSKHSVNSDRSIISTPKKDGKKAKSGRSLNEDYRDEHVDKKKGSFFSWSRNRSFGKGPKKRDFGDVNYDADFSDRNGRRESQGSLSSGASVDLGLSGSGAKNEGDPRNAASDREKAMRHCNINLPDGSCCSVPIRPGVSIRELLLGLCQKLCINLAAVDLFLVGGEKPLVLDQDCVTLTSRDLRLEKRTLFRLDLIPINRSVGLKAKPTKPVTEVLRPVVAKYGLQLSHLVAKISGETEPLDLGLPISSLDGLRVILDAVDHASGKEKPKLGSSKSHAPPLNSRSYSTTAGEEKGPSAQSCSVKTRGEIRPLRKEESVDKPGKRKQKKINIDEAEEFFDLISKAQSNRADDQRGVLSKADLVLPDFLRLGAAPPQCSTPTSGPAPTHDPRRRGQEKVGGAPHRSALNASHHSQSLDSPLDCAAPSSGCTAGRRARKPHPLDHAPFSTTLSPIPHAPSEKPTAPTAIRMVEDDDESLGDLTLVGEGDITSPNSTLLPPSPPISPPGRQDSLPEADFTPPTPCCRGDVESSVDPRFCSDATERGSGRRVGSSVNSPCFQQEASPVLSASRIIDIDGVRLEDGPCGEERDPDLSLSLEGYASELRQCQGRMRSAVYRTSELPSLLGSKPNNNNNSSGGTKARDVPCKGTFV